MKQATLSEIAAYTATPPASTPTPTPTSTTPPPNPLTCQSTGTYLMQYATATSAASAYCTAMVSRVEQGTAQIACAIQNKNPPYAVGTYPACANQSDIRFQIINDNRDTAACQGAAIENRFSVESCVTAYMNVLNQCTYVCWTKNAPRFPSSSSLLLFKKEKRNSSRPMYVEIDLLSSTQAAPIPTSKN